MVALWLPALLSFVAVLVFYSYRVASSRIEKEVAQTLARPADRPIPHEAQPPVFLSTLPATPLQKNVALVLVMVMIAAFTAIVPYASVDGPRIPAFPPVGDALLCVMFFIIGFIIIGQFLRLRTWSLLILASGFLFQSVMTVLHAISFPGFFTVFFVDQQTTPWLYVLWNSGFPLFVIVYAYLHGLQPRRLIRRHKLAVLVAVVGVTVFGVASWTSLIYWENLLPTVVANSVTPEIIDVQYSNAIAMGIGPAILLLNIIALIALWLRGDSVLDLWLKVSICASILNVSIASIIGNQRFDVSYYAGRAFGLLAAGWVLGALLDEMNRLYASLYMMMETQLLESEAKYRAIFDTTVDAIVVINGDGVIKSFNRAAELMLGYSPDEVLENNVCMLMPEPYHTAHDQYLSNYHATGVCKIIGIRREVQGLRKDGKPIALDLSVTEWRSGDEQLFTGILRDISDRKQMEQQLIQSQKMEAIGQLTGGMAHDFNNILGVVIGNLDMLTDYFPTGIPEELTDALTASTAGADLVQRLLAFARRQPLQPKCIYLNEMVQELLPLLRRIIGGQIKIETFVDDNIWPVVADPAQFENVILNLVINARDAMPHGGKLSIECRSHMMDEFSAAEYDVPVGTYTTLIVSDTGVGIPKEIMTRVFDPFFTTKPPGTGSGLGLSMVFGYTKQSGGVVRIYSEVGEGTSVRVYLPSAPNGNREEEDAISIDTSNLHGNEHILVVEDTTAARVVAQRILTSLGYTVRLASDSTEALLIVDSGEKFDMLFTDIVMPGMGGLELAQLIRKRHPGIKVLFASGFSRTPTEDIERLRATYITKPYRKLDIATTIRNIFNHRGGK